MTEGSLFHYKVVIYRTVKVACLLGFCLFVCCFVKIPVLDSSLTWLSASLCQQENKIQI